MLTLLLLLPVLCLSQYPPPPNYDLASEIFGVQGADPYNVKQVVTNKTECVGLLKHCMECKVLYQYWLHFSTAYECTIACQKYTFEIYGASDHSPVPPSECESVSSTVSESVQLRWNDPDSPDSPTTVIVIRPESLLVDLAVTGGVWLGEQEQEGLDIFPQGWGELTYNQGDHLNREKYVGYMEKGAMEGHGNLFWKDGSVYSGQFSNNVKQGEGSLFYSNGDIFVGAWDGEKKSGSGEYKFSSGGRYVGGFTAGSQEGAGEFSTVGLGLSWDLFKGQYEEGGRKEGEVSFNSGDSYQGKFSVSLGTYSGQGKYVWACGRVYTGEFVSGLPEGEGELEYPEGWRYVGGFSHGKFNGYGTFYWSSTHWYQGTFLEGKMTGKGNLQLEDGGLFEVNLEDSSEEEEEDTYNGLYYPDNQFRDNYFEAKFDGEKLRYKKPVTKTKAKKGGYGK